MKLTIKTAADIAADAQAQNLAQQHAQAQAYLDSTDWLIVRLAETGKPIPPDVIKARAKARHLLSA